MLMGNCENMVLISPTNNEWPSQNHHHHHHNQIDEKGMNHMASTAKIPMDKPSTGSSQEQQQQQQQQALKCPRCDSSNTKFCYYNNYSLTQPRHFCKACKRYWTRGGTLRNVPVGGGCRKNKRIKRPSSSSSSACSSYSANINDPPLLPPSSSSTPPPLTAATTNHHMNPLFYGLPSNPSDLNHLQFSGYDLDLDGHHHHHHQQHQLSGLGLGFSSGLMSNEDYRNGFASNSLLSSYGSMFGSSPSSMTSTTTTTTTTPPPTMASIIASSLHQQQKFMQGGEGCEGNRAAANYHFKSLFPFENMQIGSNTNGDGGGIGVKVEDGQQHRFGWTGSSATNIVPSSQNHQIQQIGSSTDNPSVYWNNTNWPDLTNIGSSVTSLI